MISLSTDKLERLSFAKYLLKQASFHKEKNSPLNSFTILILHDLVEIFLQVALEVHSPESEKKTTRILDDMTIKINEKIEPKSKQPINRQFIKRLNETRNPLKHSSIFANAETIKN